MYPPQQHQQLQKSVQQVPSASQLLGAHVSNQSGLSLILKKERQRGQNGDPRPPWRPAGRVEKTAEELALLENGGPSYVTSPVGSPRSSVPHYFAGPPSVGGPDSGGAPRLFYPADFSSAVPRPDGGFPPAPALAGPERRSISPTWMAAAASSRQPAGAGAGAGLQNSMSTVAGPTGVGLIHQPPGGTGLLGTAAAAVLAGPRGRGGGPGASSLAAAGGSSRPGQGQPSLFTADGAEVSGRSEDMYVRPRAAGGSGSGGTAQPVASQPQQQQQQQQHQQPTRQRSPTRDAASGGGTLPYQASLEELRRMIAAKAASGAAAAGAAAGPVGTRTSQQQAIPWEQQPPLSQQAPPQQPLGRSQQPNLPLGATQAHNRPAAGAGSLLEHQHQRQSLAAHGQQQQQQDQRPLMQQQQHQQHVQFSHGGISGIKPASAAAAATVSAVTAGAKGPGGPARNGRDGLAADAVQQHQQQQAAGAWAQPAAHGRAQHTAQQAAIAAAAASLRATATAAAGPSAPVAAAASGAGAGARHSSAPRVTVRRELSNPRQLPHRPSAVGGYASAAAIAAALAAAQGQGQGRASAAGPSAPLGNSGDSGENSRDRVAPRAGSLGRVRTQALRFSAGGGVMSKPAGPGVAGAHPRPHGGAIELAELLQQHTTHGQAARTRAGSYPLFAGVRGSGSGANVGRAHGAAAAKGPGVGPGGLLSVLAHMPHAAVERALVSPLSASRHSHQRQHQHHQQDEEEPAAGFHAQQPPYASTCYMYSPPSVLTEGPHVVAAPNQEGGEAAEAPASTAAGPAPAPTPVWTTEAVIEAVIADTYVPAPAPEEPVAPVDEEVRGEAAVGRVLCGLVVNAEAGVWVR